MRCLFCGSEDHDSIELRTMGERFNLYAIYKAIGLRSTSYMPAAGQSGRAPGRIYFIEAVGGERIKIGWTGTDPKYRGEALGNGCPFPLKLLLTLKGTIQTERAFHRLCREAHAHNEWFHATPGLRALIGVLSCVPGLCYRSEPVPASVIEAAE